jgi:multidrug efflux pump subunit AcrA (membrane-fusion protein)
MGAAVGVTRRYIFPILRILVWAVIAAALVKLAFAGSSIAAAEDPASPTGQITDPVVEVVTGTITNSVEVTASVVADPSVPVRATMAGLVSQLFAADGQAVEAGAPVLEIRQEIPQDPIVKTDPETGIQTVTERKPKVTLVTVTTPVAGTLSLPTLKDQNVSVGDQVATVQPGTLSVTGTLTPDQQYRLIGAPTEATVTLKGGPAPFTCSGLRIGAAAQGTQGEQGQSASGQVTCAIPPGVTAFAGLGADIEIVNGTAQDALVVPVTAVQGSVQNGNVWVVARQGAEPEETAVILGLTDGENVQVVEGIELGDTVLQFIPVPGGSGDVDCGDPAQYDPTVCGG